MLDTPVRRGRPKGTGIDDNQRLEQLAELLRLHPNLRPTTAIRQMGYSDPSAIRRLRDKYKIFALGTHTTLKGLIASAGVGGDAKRTPSVPLRTR
jgi:hypothetical protein